MKWIRTFTAVVATLGVTGVAQAGLFNLGATCGAAKSCGCAPSCQPVCCKPTITRPCGTSVHTYQRKCSDIKPPCCNTGCAPKCCAPAPQCAAPAPQCAAPAAQCAPAPAPRCAAPAPRCAAPAPRCAAPAPTRCAPAPTCCQVRCCNADPCEIAELIYKSQTACYAKDRRSAIHKLGDKFDCVCNPEIMCALVYALNDSDERVRAKAADEIGDQIRANGCCDCKVTAALTCALGDCDWQVRRQAEEALRACGYEVVDGCCNPCGSTGCGNTGCGNVGPAAAPAPAPAPAEDNAAPAPAPPTEEDPKAYFPSRLNQQQTLRPAQKRNRLSDLFGFLN